MYICVYTVAFFITTETKNESTLLTTENIFKIMLHLLKILCYTVATKASYYSMGNCSLLSENINDKKPKNAAHRYGTFLSLSIDLKPLYTTKKSIAIPTK